MICVVILEGVCIMETTTIAETVANVDDYSNHVEQYTQLIHTYGASAVIIAVFLIMLLVVLMYILRNNQKTNNQLIKQQQELVNMLLERAKEPQKEEAPHPVKEPNLVETFLNINDSIKEILKDISEDLDTSRIAVYVFHNGVYSSHGLPFFKISCVCEIIKKNSGVTKNLKSHSGLPLQMFDNSVSYIYKHGKMSIKNTEDDSDEIVHSTPVLTGMLKSNNIKSSSGIAIYDHDNNIVGIMIAEFTDTKESLEDVEKTLIERAPLLSPILEYSGIYNSTNK